MSRYRLKNNDGATVEYGYDTILREYFLYPEDENEPEINNRSKILEYMEDNNFILPEHHKDKLVLDLPI